MRLITTISTVGLAAGLAFTGAQVAGATSPAAAAPVASATPAGITLPSGGVLEQRITGFCHRVPNLIQRADQAQARINADAGTRGSLAWLKARKAKATANHHPLVVKRIERRIDRRTERLARLPELKTKLAAATTECASLNLPTPTPTASASSSADSNAS